MEGNGHSETLIPAKDLFRIGEVSRLTSTKPFVLRYWETEFPMLQPAKSPKGHRLYRREDVETVFTIKRLLYEEGFTIAGARRHLRDAPQGAVIHSAGGGIAPAPSSAVAAAGDDGPVRPHSAVVNRNVLLELRDSLRELLTVLESE